MDCTCGSPWFEVFRHFLIHVERKKDKIKTMCVSSAIQVPESYLGGTMLRTLLVL